MKLRNTLVGIVLAGALTLTGCGNSKYPQYEFNDRIKQEHVTFTSYLALDFSRVNSLTIQKPNRVTLVYFDSINNDLRIDKVEIRDIMGNPIYREEKNREILDVAQEQFNNYLKLISEAKNNKDKEREEAIKKEREKQEKIRLEEILKIFKQ